jgi:hypothetical protein
LAIDTVAFAVMTGTGRNFGYRRVAAGTSAMLPPLG